MMLWVIDFVSAAICLKSYDVLPRLFYRWTNRMVTKILCVWCLRYTCITV